MHPISSYLSFLAAAAVLASIPISTALAQAPVNPAYVIVDLGASGGTSSAGYGINNSGQVTGVVFKSGNSHAFLYSNGVMTDLGTLSGRYSYGYGVNDAGQVTGSSDSYAFLYSGGIMTKLGTLSGGWSAAYAVNNTGQITGASDSRAFLYSGGSMINLGTLGGSRSYGYGINDAGQITGWSDTPGNTSQHAFLYSNGIMTDLGSVGSGYSQGYSINNSGQVTGLSRALGGPIHAFLYSGGTMQDLNTLVGSNPLATDINEGNGGLGNPGNHINDWGQIAAQGTVSSGQTHALLLNPVNPLTSTSGGGAIRDTRLIGGMSYSKFTATTNPGNLHTTVSMLGGTAGNGGAGTYGLNRDVVVTLTAGAPGLFASDIVTLTGTESDTIVLQLTYDETLAISLFGNEANSVLTWLDPGDGRWKNAVEGNTGGTPTFVAGAYDPTTDFHLGYYGVDVVNNTVWAVVNHNSQFAVTAVPEPSAAGVAIGLGVLGMALARRRTHRA